MVARFVLLSFTFIAVWISFCYGMCDQRSIGGKLNCCYGKNSNCFVKIQSKRGRGQTNQICYCDSYCKFTKDCCEDFEQTQRSCKGIRDCKVGRWGAWSKCSTGCGFGTMNRKRSVLETPQNGGEKCPALKQTRGCNLNAICNKNKFEEAYILPIAYRRPDFGKWGYENILPALNLQERDEEANKNRVAPTSYCIHYKFISKRRGCDGTWADQMNPSVPVCTECQSRIADGGHCKGEGELSVKTRWKALGQNRCRGDWIRLGESIPNCSCKDEGFSNFVFV